MASSSSLSHAAGVASQECIASALSYDDNVFKDVSIDRVYFQDCFPTTPLNDASSTISISIPLGEDFLDLNQSFLSFEVSIVQSNGAAITTALSQTASYALTNLVGATIWRSIDVYQSDQLLTDSFNCYAFNSYIQTCLSFGVEARDSVLALAHFYTDLKPEQQRADDPASNCSFKTRAKLTNLSKKLRILTPIFNDLFNQNRLLPPLTPLRIELVRASSDFCIISNITDCTYKVKLHDVKLMARRVKTFPSVRLAIENSMANKALRFPINSTNTKPFFIPANVTSFAVDDLFQHRGAIPRFAAIAFLQETVYRGTMSTNPLQFTSHNVKSIKLTYNGLTYPTPQPLTPVFTGDSTDWARAYLSLHLNTMKSNTGSWCPLADFKDKFCLFVLDLGRFYSESMPDHALQRAEAPVREYK